MPAHIEQVRLRDSQNSGVQIAWQWPVWRWLSLPIKNVFAPKVQTIWESRSEDTEICIAKLKVIIFSRSMSRCSHLTIQLITVNYEGEWVRKQKILLGKTTYRYNLHFLSDGRIVNKSSKITEISFSSLSLCKRKTEKNYIRNDLHKKQFFFVWIRYKSFCQDFCKVLAY